MSDSVWLQTVGKFSEVSTDQLAQSLVMCVDELNSDIITVDLRGCSDQIQALQALAQRLNFPEYFGGNLDALYDVVSERVSQGLSVGRSPQTWLFKTKSQQQKVLFPIKDTLTDAMSEATDVAISVVWWII